MALGKNFKFALCEVLQFAFLATPLLVVMQRFAAIVWHVWRTTAIPGDADVAYWLIVTSSVAYVTTVALLVWVPMKYLVFKKRRSLISRKWRPVTLAYVVLSTLPCFAFLIAGSQIQINNGLKYDAFTELPVSLVLLSLVCIDITERIRQCCSSAQVHDGIPPPGLAGVEPLSTLTPYTPAAITVAEVSSHREQNSANTGQIPGFRPVPRPTRSLRSEANGTIPGPALSGSHGRQFSVLDPTPRETASPVSSYDLTGPLHFLHERDPRAEIFTDAFIFWLDTVEMVRVAGHPAIYYSGWALPIYIFSYLSVLRVAMMPGSQLLPTLGVTLQDLPFLFIRAGLVSVFGFTTPLLYLLKNLLASLAFVYFNFVTKLSIFNREGRSFGW